MGWWSPFSRAVALAQYCVLVGQAERRVAHLVQPDLDDDGAFENIATRAGPRPPYTVEFTRTMIMFQATTWTLTAVMTLASLTWSRRRMPELQKLASKTWFAGVVAASAGGRIVSPAVRIEHDTSSR